MKSEELGLHKKALTMWSESFLWKNCIKFNFNIIILTTITKRCIIHTIRYIKKGGTINTENTKENRTYKDSVIVDIFCEDEKAKENQLSLYNALHNTNYTLDEIKIQDIRIDNVIYMNFRNDMAFNYNDRLLILSEHQSTINNNMPLRSLMHIGRTYEKLVPMRERYKKRMAKIPKPEFYVLYNGTEVMDNEKILKLSDAYIDDENSKEIHKNHLDNNEEYSLQLIVRILNINLEAEADILDKCPILKEYAQFVSCVRRHKELDEKNAMENAIKECIDNDILKDYLLRRGSEVVNMLCAEYDYDMDIAVQREESYEDGFIQGKVDDIINLLNDIGYVSEEMKNMIIKQEDVKVLSEWLKISARVSSIEEFKEKISA